MAVSPLALLLALASLLPLAEGPGSPSPAEEQAKSGLLTVAGTVRMPDGTPAAGATVETVSVTSEPSVKVLTDESGRFRIVGAFVDACNLYVRSENGNHQATLMVPFAAVRSVSASPIEMVLAPAIVHEVSVVSGDHPVEGATVSASGLYFKVTGATDGEGKAQLKIPAGAALQQLVAWSPELGVAGVRGLDDGPSKDTSRLTLLPPGTHRIRVIDPEGRPVGRLELGVSVRTKDSGWIIASDIDAARVRTDADGVAVVPWAPREGLDYVEPKISDPEWKIDQIDLKQISDGTTTVHVRRTIVVEGRLAMPEGANPEGVLISGYGFGTGNMGSVPRGRARRDGSFTLRVAPDHGYLLTVSDLQWASDLWSGKIIGADPDKPAEIAITVYPATPLKIHVTRGPDHKPIANAWVEYGSSGSVYWVDNAGEKHTGTAGPRGWLRTDAEGVARTAVGAGAQAIRLSEGEWNEERKVRVSSGNPVEIAFHRQWMGDRRLTGRLTLEGEGYHPSETLVVHAWTPQYSSLPIVWKPEVRPDGTFEVAFDANTMTLLAIDPARRQSAFASIGPEDSDVELALRPTATYAGVLVDENDSPLADHKISIALSGYQNLASNITDEAGRFRFVALPTGIRLRMSVEITNDDRVDRRYLGERSFETGEAREHDRVKVGRRAVATAPVPVPLADRVALVCRDARLGGTRVVVVVRGDDSNEVSSAADRLLDADEVGAVGKYLPLNVGGLDAKEAGGDTAGWPAPAPGEVALVVLGGDRKVIAAERIDVKSDVNFRAVGEAFLRRHAPPSRDALALLADARSEARESGKRVWVVLGGTRCGPCFRLSRWMDDHHVILEEEYVIVKVLLGLDEHADEAFAAFPESNGAGIPWFAITEPDGAVLATSMGPLGNTGFPSQVEGVRHLQRMLEGTSRRLSSEEISALVGSLSPSR